MTDRIKYLLKALVAAPFIAMQAKADLKRAEAKAEEARRNYAIAARTRSTGRMAAAYDELKKARHEALRLSGRHG